jgi:hypothetical protein
MWQAVPKIGMRGLARASRFSGAREFSMLGRGLSGHQDGVDHEDPGHCGLGRSPLGKNGPEDLNRFFDVVLRDIVMGYHPHVSGVDAIRKDTMIFQSS